MIINNNVNATNVHKNLSEVIGKQEVSMEKLNLGNKINRAVDDAKIVGVLDKSGSEIYDNDEVLIIETVEKELSETQEIGQILNELEIQSAEEFHTEENKEFDAIKMLNRDKSGRISVLMLKGLNLMQLGIASTVLEVMMLRAIKAI